MEFRQYPVQTFVWLLVILCAAFVALICDFLRGCNEQLRELKTRRNHGQRRSRTLTLQPPQERRRATAPEALAAMERGAQMASAPVTPE